VLALLAPVVAFAAPPQGPTRLPFKVFILAGQSNMQGQAVADLEGKDDNGGKGTLANPWRSRHCRHLADFRGKSEPGPASACSG
jgi:hypothetical protein